MKHTHCWHVLGHNFIATTLVCCQCGLQYERYGQIAPETHGSHQPSPNSPAVPMYGKRWKRPYENEEAE
jgi:hypothetical protein